MYAEWSTKNGSLPVTETAFARLLKKRSRGQSKAGGGHVRYLGIRPLTLAERT